MELYIVIWIIVLCFVGYFFLYNSIIGARNNVDESFSTIDTVLQNRYNLIPNLVEVVKQYASHETSIFKDVSKMRSELVKSGQKNASKSRFKKENMLQSGLQSIFAVAENYPDLKANTNFLNLQSEWSEIENRLQAARRAYNSAVKILRNKKQMFPSSIVASMMNLKTYDMFEASKKAKVEKMSAKSMFN